MTKDFINVFSELDGMKEIVLLGGLLVILLVVLGFNQPSKEQMSDEADKIEWSETQRIAQRDHKNEEWEIITCKLIEDKGDTIITLNKLVKIKNKEQ